jgi:hypothetical protein
LGAKILKTENFRALVQSVNPDTKPQVCAQRTPPHKKQEVQVQQNKDD